MAEDYGSWESGLRGALGNQYTAVHGYQSPYDSIKNRNDLMSTFGLQDSVSSMFDPARTNLRNQLGQSRSAAANRMGGRSANPEMQFGGIEQGYASALGGLESQASQAQLQQNNYIAQLLNSVFGNQQQGFYSKQGLLGQNLGQQGGMMSSGRQFQFDQENAPGTWDDIFGGINAFGNLAAGLVR